MRTKLVLPLVVLFATWFVSALHSQPPRPPQPPEPVPGHVPGVGPIGRYQLTPLGDGGQVGGNAFHFLVIDTATGQTWRYSTLRDPKWNDLGSPIPQPIRPAKGDPKPGEVRAELPADAVTQPERLKGQLQPFAGKNVFVQANPNVAHVLENVEVRQLGGRSFLVGKTVKNQSPQLTQERFSGATVWIPLDQVTEMMELEPAAR